jgi:beta-galactosidase
MLGQGISVNLNMAHGGTSFGFMSGANFDKVYQPDISSYDYDSPLDEAGRPTEKFFAFRETIKKYLPAGTEVPRLPAMLPVIAIPRFGLKESAGLDDLLGKAVRSERPQTMEALGQSYGFILYRKGIERAESGKLEITNLRDYALISQDGKRLAALDRRLGRRSLQVELAAGQSLDLLVENMGRINFGPRMVDDRKGILGAVSLNRNELRGWEHYTLPMDNLERLKFTSGPRPAPAFYRGTFQLASTGDTFLDMRGWGKGYAWVNGRNLGRYWKIGPQQTLFVPAAWLKVGENTVMALDLEPGGTRSIEGLKDAIWETPAGGGKPKAES